jgi:2-amino-4-hydroxy-6-hydroxymethyldihydropteridine diphosphokinase
MTCAGTLNDLHPLVSAAALGELPEWGSVSAPRRAHMDRVALLLSAWADGLGLSDRDRRRWVSLAYLHDCLKESPAESLLAWLSPPLSELPKPVLHGPAAAARMEAEGVTDEELLNAVRYHTLGHRDLGRAGRALYAADFLDPGRSLAEPWRDSLRARMPKELDLVVKEILGERIRHLRGRRQRVHPQTLSFWSSLGGEDR